MPFLLAKTIHPSIFSSSNRLDRKIFHFIFTCHNKHIVEPIDHPSMRQQHYDQLLQSIHQHTIRQSIDQFLLFKYPGHHTSEYTCHHHTSRGFTPTYIRSTSTQEVTILFPTRSTNSIIVYTYLPKMMSWEINLNHISSFFPPDRPIQLPSQISIPSYHSFCS